MDCLETQINELEFLDIFIVVRPELWGKIIKREGFSGLS